MAPELKIIKRIEALFRQAEGTDNEEEARVFTAKAQELLTKHALSEFDLDLLGKSRTKDTIQHIAIRVNEPFMNRKSELLSAIASANGVKVVRGNVSKSWYAASTYSHDIRTVSSDRESKTYRYMYLTGFSLDIESLTLLYTSLLIQAKREIKRGEVESWENKSTWTSHFYLGFTTEVRTRLRAGQQKSKSEVVEEAKAQGFDLLPVLVERTEQVTKSYDEKWGGKLSRSRATGYTHGSTSGYSAGREAGRSTDVGNKRIGGVGALNA